MPQTEDRWDGAVNHRRKKKHMSGKGKCSYITVSNIIEKEETHKVLYQSLSFSGQVILEPILPGRRYILNLRPPPAFLTHLRVE